MAGSLLEVINRWLEPWAGTPKGIFAATSLTNNGDGTATIQVPRATSIFTDFDYNNPGLTGPALITTTSNAAEYVAWQDFIIFPTIPNPTDTTIFKPPSHGNFDRYEVISVDADQGIIWSGRPRRR